MNTRSPSRSRTSIQPEVAFTVAAADTGSSILTDVAAWPSLFIMMVFSYVDLVSEATLQASTVARHASHDSQLQGVLLCCLIFRCGFFRFRVRVSRFDLDIFLRLAL